MATDKKIQPKAYDWMVVIEPGEENLWPNGKCNEVKHKTRRGKGTVGQAIVKHKKLPPNCS